MKADDMFPKYMMATTAKHQLGDISNKEPDICVVASEDGDDYIGNWVFGLGFFGVRFPKATTRELSPQDVQHYNGMQLSMCSLHTGEESYVCGSITI